MATMIAMMLALGTSMVASKRTTSAERTALATTASQSRSEADGVATGASTPDARSPRRNPGQARAATPAGAPTATAPAPGSTAPETGSSPSTSVAAAGAREAHASTAADRVDYTTAAPGRWSLRITTKSTSLLGQETEQQVDGALAVEAPEGKKQRVRLDSGPLAVVDERLSYADGSKRLTEIVIWTGSGEPRSFSSPAGFVDLAATFRAGETWEWNATTADGLTTVHTTVEAARRARQTVGDDAETDTVESLVTMTFSGDRTGTLTRRVWFSPELGVAVRIEEELRVENPDGGRGEWSALAELVRASPDPEPVLPPTTTTTTTTASGAGRSGG